MLEAPSVNAALEAIADFAPDLVVSDVGMPGRDGYDLIREIRSRTDGLRSLPAIALSAFARAEDQQRALENGFQLHLAKPVNPEELVTSITTVLQQSDRSNR